MSEVLFSDPCNTRSARRGTISYSPQSDESAPESLKRLDLHMFTHQSRRTNVGSGMARKMRE